MIGLIIGGIVAICGLGAYAESEEKIKAENDAKEKLKKDAEMQEERLRRASASFDALLHEKDMHFARTGCYCDPSEAKFISSHPVPYGTKSVYRCDHCDNVFHDIE